MTWYAYLLLFVSGLLLVNGIPHFVQGLSGAPFQSPFASPPGIGESSPLVNVYWGFANLAGGGLLLAKLAPRSLVSGEDYAAWAVFAAAGLVIGTFLARHFGTVRAAGAAAKIAHRSDS